MRRTCIIGAGISGLALAWQIKRQGGNVIVLEQSKFVGGSMRSTRDGDYLAEEGPNSILIDDARIEEFLNSIPGLSNRIVEASPEAKKRFIVRDGKLHAVPMGPLSAITTPLWSLGSKLRVLKEAFIKKHESDAEESVADFVKRRFGKELCQYAINPLVGGIYAGDPEQLSMRYGFPKIYALEQNYGGLIKGAIAKLCESKKNKDRSVKKRIISFEDGIRELPQKTAEALGEDTHRNVSIDKIQKADDGWEVTYGQTTENFERLIVTIPAHRIKELPLSDRVHAQINFLETIDYPPVSVLSLAYKRSDIAHPLDGFGALVPECEGRKILGVLFPSSLFAQRAPDGEVLLTAFVGGERQPELATGDTDALLRMVRVELTQLLGIKGEPTFVHHKHWDKAIPQYKLGYGEVLNQIEEFEKHNEGLQLYGNYRTGISVTNCIEAALNHAI
ncbi:MAG: protoporphyrinogen oxidase [Lentimonas sp.]